MPDMVTILVACAVFLLLVALQVIVHAKRPVRRAVGGIFAGVGTLIAVNIAGIFTGVTLPFSLLSIGISGVAGMPGVTLMLLLQLVFR